MTVHKPNQSILFLCGEESFSSHDNKREMSLNGNILRFCEFVDLQSFIHKNIFVSL